MISILIHHSDPIVTQGLSSFLSSNSQHKIHTFKNYSKCHDSASFLNKLEKVFVIIVEGKLLNLEQCLQLNNFEYGRVIVCDRSVEFDSLLLALNCNSSYVSLEHNDADNLILAINCVLIDSVFICPQAKQELNSCVFQWDIQQRQAVTQLEKVDREILVLASQGYNHNEIGSMINYSPFNVGYRLRNIIQKLNLQTKQEAFTLAINLGLVSNFNRQMQVV